MRPGNSYCTRLNSACRRWRAVVAEDRCTVTDRSDLLPGVRWTLHGGQRVGLRPASAISGWTEAWLSFCAARPEFRSGTRSESIRFSRSRDPMRCQSARCGRQNAHSPIPGSGSRTRAHSRCRQRSARIPGWRSIGCRDRRVGGQQRRVWQRMPVPFPPGESFVPRGSSPAEAPVRGCRVPPVQLWPMRGPIPPVGGQSLGRRCVSCPALVPHLFRGPTNAGTGRSRGGIRRLDRSPLIPVLAFSGGGCELESGKLAVPPASAKSRDVPPVGSRARDHRFSPNRPARDDCLAIIVRGSSIPAMSMDVSRMVSLIPAVGRPWSA